MSETINHAVLYQPSLSLRTSKWSTTIEPSDIVSISIMNQYDTRTFPIIRFRLYCDLSIMQQLTDDPDNITLGGVLHGNVYRMSQEDPSPVMVSGAHDIHFTLKIYVEHKNIPSSIMDQFENGIKKESDLNVNIKTPIELYGYHASMPYYMRRSAQSVYKNMSLQSVIEDIFQRGSIQSKYIDPLDNQTKFDQILIPNLSVSQTMSFFDTYYGLYQKGAHLYGDIDGTMYMTNADCRKMPDNVSLPIYINSYKDNSDMGGLRYINQRYYMSTMATNVSVITESDIERQLQSLHLASINVNTNHIDIADLDQLYSEEHMKEYLTIAQSNLHATPNVLHKHQNQYLASMIVARIQEKITKVDVSGVGFDVGAMKIHSRYNLVFESPIRGIYMDRLYRAVYANHVFTNTDSNLFIAQTTMHLCTN